MVLRPQHDARRRRKAARQAGAVGHRMEHLKLRQVQRMVGIVGTGEVADQHLGARLDDDRRHDLPFLLLDAEAVHPRVELHAEGMAGKRFEMPGDLVEAVEHRRQVEVTDQRRVALHMPRQDVDLRPRPQRAAHLLALFGGGDEEAPRPRPRQRPRHPLHPQPVGIRLHHGRGLHLGAGKPVKRAPVGGDRVQIDGEDRGSHGRPFSASGPHGSRGRFP